MTARATPEQPLPADTEARLANFTELVATAIANAESRAELMASRARIVAAADETRRRIERDLHDGIQQRLVSLGLELRAAQATVPPQLGELAGVLARVADGLGERVRRAAGDLPRHSPRDPVRGRPGAGAHSAAPPFGGTGRARPARRATAARAGRGRRVLRGVRGVDQRRQARARVGRDTSSSTPTTRSCGWRSATTASAEPTPARGPDCSGSATASKRSAARCRSPAPPATAPRCWSRSRSKTRAGQCHPSRSAGSITRHATQLDDGASLRAGAGWHASRKAEARRLLKPSLSTQRLLRPPSPIHRKRSCYESH